MGSVVSQFYFLLHVNKQNGNDIDLFFLNPNLFANIELLWCMRTNLIEHGFVSCRPRVLPVLVSAIIRRIPFVGDVELGPTTFKRRHAQDVDFHQLKCVNVSVIISDRRHTYYRIFPLQLSVDCRRVVFFRPFYIIEI